VEVLTSENIYLRKYLQTHQAGREEKEQESAMIHKKAKIDPLRSARICNDSQEGKKLIRYNQQAKLQCKATLAKARAHKEPCSSMRAAP